MRWDMDILCVTDDGVQHAFEFEDILSTDLAEMVRKAPDRPNVARSH